MPTIIVRVRRADGAVETMTLAEYFARAEARLLDPRSATTVTRRSDLGLAETTFRRSHSDARHPAGFRPMPGPGVRS